MKLSIITINYNDSQGLEKTIVSVINQTYRDFQYIVIDGNSTDGSRDVLEKYDKYIDKWISEPDSGIYNAMNKGAYFANGEYLLFLNSGDYLYNKNSLENLFKNNFHEDIVSCSLYTYSKKNICVQTPPRKISLYTFIDGSSLAHPSTLISKKIFLQVGGYNEDSKIVSDWIFFIEALIINNCSYISFPKIILSSFNCFGVSSTSTEQRLLEVQKYLGGKFPRIIEDYMSLKEEFISNSIYWIVSRSNFFKFLLIVPFKIINRVLRLRNYLGKRVGIYFIKS